MHLAYFKSFPDTRRKISADCSSKWENQYSDITISKHEINRAAINLCRFKGRIPTPEERRFYESLVGMIFDTSASSNLATIRYAASEAYIDSEESIKRSLSFFAGMIAASLVTTKVLKLNRPYHVKDSCIKIQRNSSNRFIPDFCGFDSSGNAFLLEAKGTFDKVDEDTLKHAGEQLKSIGAVRYHPGLWKNGLAVKRYIVTSEFCKPSKSKNKNWRISQVDPASRGSAVLVSESHVAFASYYDNLARLFKADGYTEERYGQEFRITSFGKTKIGLEEKMYEAMKSLYSPEEHEKRAGETPMSWKIMLREAFDCVVSDNAPGLLEQKKELEKRLRDTINHEKPYGKNKNRFQAEIDEAYSKLENIMMQESFGGALHRMLEKQYPETMEQIDCFMRTTSNIAKTNRDNPFCQPDGVFLFDED